jgi:hypothetical protein
VSEGVRYGVGTTLLALGCVAMLLAFIIRSMYLFFGGVALAAAGGFIRPTMNQNVGSGPNIPAR